MIHKTGYAQTKVTCEKLLRLSPLEPPPNIFRIASISGNSLERKAFVNPHDWTTLLLQAAIRIRGVVMDTNVKLHWLPVDFVAKGVVGVGKTLSNQRVGGKVFHFIGDGK